MGVALKEKEKQGCPRAADPLGRNGQRAGKGAADDDVGVIAKRRLQRVPSALPKRAFELGNGEEPLPRWFDRLRHAVVLDDDADRAVEALRPNVAGLVQVT